ncbi:kelch-like protein 2 [Acyrthosiphon pisum]|uniref:Uncharacterized protein n=1 Tax=Acyrthosiphon pisum TaxID=7029 RepID=A0A8R2JUT8_ACYPI|nr:kelch-like protein 2 [Acyrthosiphon pisum]
MCNLLDKRKCYTTWYDPPTPVSQISTNGRTLVIGVLDNVMYAIGGACQELGSSVYLKSVEAYSPISKVWSPIEDMYLSRYNPSVVRLKKKMEKLKTYFMMNSSRCITLSPDPLSKLCWET